MAILVRRFLTVIGLVSAAFSGTAMDAVLAAGQSVLSDQEKQALILGMVNKHKNDEGNAWPTEVILAMICQEAGEGAFRASGRSRIYKNYVYGPWTEPDNTWDSRRNLGYAFFSDGLMQVTPASGYTGRNGYGYETSYIHHESTPSGLMDEGTFGGYLHTQEGYEAGIDDGIAYVDLQFRMYRGRINAILHHNTGPNSLWIYKTGRGDPRYLEHIAWRLATCVPRLYGLSNQAWVEALLAGQKMVNEMLARLPANQSVSTYQPYQIELDARLRQLRP